MPPSVRFVTHHGQRFPVYADEIPAEGVDGVALDDGTTVTDACASHIQRLVDKPLVPHVDGIDGAQEVVPGVRKLTDPHDIYAVPSTSTDRIHTVVVNTRTGAMRCDGPRCDGRTCSHQRRVLAARAGF